jgi:hypothetical protein
MKTRSSVFSPLVEKLTNCSNDKSSCIWQNLQGLFWRQDVCEATRGWVSWNHLQVKSKHSSELT